MTTPVTEMERKGNMTMQFYLPLKFDKNNVPIPSRPDVEIVNIEGGYFAVIVYSGRSSDKNFIKHKDILENELKKDDISILGQPIKATYNGPFTLPMLRRNEVMFEIERNTLKSIFSLFKQWDKEILDSKLFNTNFKCMYF